MTQTNGSIESLTVIEGGKSESLEVGAAEKVALVVGSKAWASKVRRRAKDLSQTLDLGYVELARILYQVYDTPIEGDAQRGPVYRAWGYESFGEYAEKELGLHQKKAERLRKIWYILEIQCKDMDPELKERLVNLGYSKVRELVRVITLRSAPIWIEQAEHMSYRQLNAAVVEEVRRQGVEAAVLGSADGGASPTEGGEAEERLPTFDEEEREVFKQKRFDLAPSQLENVSTALKKASAMSGSVKEGHLLDLICTDFLASNDLVGNDTDKRLRYVANMERNLGLRLIAVDPETKEIVYGVEALEMVHKALSEEEEG